jgi:hypothetical protein
MRLALINAVLVARLATAIAALATAVAALAVADVAVAGWRPPVAGEVVRPFDPGGPFEAGRHRGVDLVAPPGTAVQAPCAGEVAFAGAVAATRVVTLRCGPWRVTHLPLASIAVRQGAAVRPRALLGTVGSAAGHRGLHLGVRREGTRFGYVDPLRFLAARSAPPPLGRAPRPARPPRAAPPAGPRGVRSPPARAPAPASRRPARAPARSRPATARSGPAPARSRPATAFAGADRAPPDSNPGRRAPFAPWTAWAGLALVLAGAGLRLRGRRAGRRGRVVAAGTLTR